MNSNHIKLTNFAKMN